MHGKELENKLKKLDRQIYALEWQIPRDVNEKDKDIHTNALLLIRQHREKLEQGD